MPEAEDRPPDVGVAFGKIQKPLKTDTTGTKEGHVPVKHAKEPAERNVHAARPVGVAARLVIGAGAKAQSTREDFGLRAEMYADVKVLPCGQPRLRV